MSRYDDWLLDKIADEEMRARMELYVPFSPGVIHKVYLTDIVKKERNIMYRYDIDYQPEGGCGYTVLS